LNWNCTDGLLLMKTLLREPLLYFLLLGGLMFGVYDFVFDDANGEQQLAEIVITDGQVDALIQGFEKSRQRLPSQQELDGLLQGFVREEIMYREALAMGLDRDDPIVRRRLQQKLEFLSEDIATLDEPTDAELQAFLDDHPDLFLQPTQFTLEQIYFNSNARGSSVRSDAESLLQTLRAREKQSGSNSESNAPAQFGDPLLMTPSRFNVVSESEISRAFGAQFLEAVEDLPLGRWEGPVRSGLGLHLVFIHERNVGNLPPLAEIRKVVNREWESTKRRQANDAFYSAMRERYTVTLAEPGSANISASQRASTP